MAREILALNDISAGYGDAVAIADISLRLEEGKALALLGRNGMGKTTLIDTIVGLTRRRSGAVSLCGRDVTFMRPDQRARAGVGWSPQERNIFSSLTVEENITALLQKGVWNLARLYGLFPRLDERRGHLGSNLSGGEQQMLAIARALALNPRLLLLDEPLEGLAPVVADELLATLRRLVREEGQAMIIVEQSARKILPITDDAIILERGRIAYSAQSEALAADVDALARFLGVGARDAGAAAPGRS